MNGQRRVATNNTLKLTKLSSCNLEKTKSQFEVLECARLRVLLVFSRDVKYSFSRNSYRMPDHFGPPVLHGSKFFEEGSTTL